MDVRAMSQLAGAAPVDQLSPPAPALRTADDLVVEDFNGAMRPGAVAAEPGIPPTGAQPASGAASGTRSIGDAILAGIEDVAGKTVSAWTGVQNGLSVSTEFTTADVINFQAHVIQFSFLYELVGKGVSKASQNIDSLVKLQ